MAPEERRLSRLITLMAVGAGVAVANIYYAQPLLDALGAGFGTGRGATSTVVTLDQLGYAVGIVAFVPLGDVLDDKRLTLSVLGLAVLAAAACALAPSLAVFLVASLLGGATAVVAQILTPIAARIAPADRRGALVGRVTGGLVTGILLARAFAGLVAAVSSWRVVYAFSAVVMVALGVLLARFLPRRGPVGQLHYPDLVASMGRLLRSEGVLRRRMLYQSALFAAFSMFWTSITYELADHGVGQAGIGVFALVGAAGAVAAPLAGRLGDAGHGRLATGAALVLGSLALVLAWAGQHSLVLLALAAVVLDLAVQGCNVLGQRAIYSRRLESRSRMNTVYIGSFFSPERRDRRRPDCSGGTSAGPGSCSSRPRCRRSGWSAGWGSGADAAPPSRCADAGTATVRSGWEAEPWLTGRTSTVSGGARRWRPR